MDKTKAPHDFINIIKKCTKKVQEEATIFL